ncbi:hypothetical protein [Paramicrobacterium chengjingii]|uniref:Antitoxin n=1 Tax=Paramicrobacterium chengjingii TaxID=2769067 RepID=A0ABX6YKG3_9MICO|nr:hypothetical protein [Microbacterium chengjingii]QPZ39243.1 hypothetical protein HCR76_04045 [Microbacterium chengjingii]
MRTTIDLPDDLLRALKVRAAQRGETLKVVLMRAVSREVAGNTNAHTRVSLPLIAAGAEPTVDVTPDDIATALASDDEQYAR